jgi:superfamily I DNA/RNA helicase
MKPDPIAGSLQRNTNTAPHLIIEARAGTGKTTTLIEGLRLVKGLHSDLTPSPQQAEVWKAMCLSKTLSACFVAFNKSIATELQRRVPEGCDAMTMHSMGYKAVRQAFTTVKVNQYRVQDIISELLGKDIREIRKYDFELLRATEKLVGLCKMNLTKPVLPSWVDLDDPDDDPIENRLMAGAIDLDWQEPLMDLAAHYDVDLNGDAHRVFDLVPRVLERCKDIARDGCVDFNDMIWIPVACNLSLYRYDLLLVDEAQDLNRCQQQLALKAGRRLILCGDPKQAIYGFAGADSERFAGADSESMTRMTETLSNTPQGCETLPLTVTRRCGKAIVKEAQRYVPDFEAHETCGEGTTGSLAIDGIDGYQYAVQDNGDMILCRVNAPLVQQCFRFLRAGRRAEIQGRDVGQGLISTIKKLMKTYGPTQAADDVSLLISQLDNWRNQEERKENAKRNPSEARLIALQDRYDCILCFCEEKTKVQNVINHIEDLFTDEKNGEGIKLSSIHKAKGLEADRVFILQPEGAAIPHPMAKSPWQREQEMNLLYVAITRAINELVYVS